MDRQPKTPVHATEGTSVDFNEVKPDERLKQRGLYQDLGALDPSKYSTRSSELGRIAAKHFIRRRVRR